MKKKNDLIVVGVLLAGALLLHALADAAGRGIDALKLCLCLFKLVYSLPVLLLHGFTLSMELVQCSHPYGYLTDTQFITKYQIACGSLRLSTERPYLHLQFFYLVVYSYKIFFGFFQSPLRLFLAVAEA